MKFLHYFIITAVLAIPSCYGIQTYGKIERNIINGNTTMRLNLPYVNDKEAYTSGGTTFTYPLNWFSAPPTVQVSVQATAPHPATEMFVAEIVANSDSSTRVMVYHVNSIPSLSITEAASGDVDVCLLAIQDPAA